MLIEVISGIEGKIRPLLLQGLSPRAAVKLYSKGRIGFMKRLVNQPPRAYIPPQNLSRTLWGIEFRTPLLNAAGMFKNGEGYALVSSQGAGAYLSGTTTANSRKGNDKDGIRLPFTPYSKSGAASNWLGLPNDGDQIVAKRLQEQPRVKGCPIGASVMGSPDLEGQEKINQLAHGMHLYRDAGVDFIEINESCPNTAHGSAPQTEGLRERLEFIRKEFLSIRSTVKDVPVIVKFSNDTPREQVPQLIDLLLSLGFDGVNFGNTSTTYAQHAPVIDSSEKKIFSYYTETFGGGVSGRPLKTRSLELSRTALDYLRRQTPAQEFHVIRTGGIENAVDVKESLEIGVSLVEWYTAYFEQFSKHGHDLYKTIYASLGSVKKPAFEGAQATVAA